MLTDETGQRFLDPEAEASVRETEVQSKLTNRPPQQQLVDANGLPRKDLGLPTLNGEAVASLSTCHVNIHKSCNFHEALLMTAFAQEWKKPAPKHCQRKRAANQKEELPPDLRLQHLGVNMESVCDLLSM